MNEKLDAMINIKGLQFYDEGDDDCIEFATDGEYSYSDKLVEIVYMESELTGLEGTQTTITVEGPRVMMTRTGTVNTQMVFQEGKKHYFVYETPYGNMTMGIDTYNVTAKLGENGGELKVFYSINMDSNILGKNELVINVKA